MTPDEFPAEFARRRASAILRTKDEGAVIPAMEAAVRAGFTVVEFTLTTPGALDAISKFREREGLLVGAGTVLTTDQVRDAVAAGAQFLVSPVEDHYIIRAALDAGVTPIPGCHTPTELAAAHGAGAPLQKLFPAPAGGPAWLKAVLGPLPFLNVVPTNGADASNARDWLSAGAVALGFVAPLFEPEAMAGHDWDRIEAKGRTLLESVRSAAGGAE